ncbi:AUGMIN subunit 5 [Silene latifolia]|uniref:AUGMIN subunit 5 n=1 Tax=Silene latifolia TaxID=37657 RepID=UPI003D789148
MQTSTSSSSAMAAAAQPDAILEWLHKEMGYRPSGPFPGPTRPGSEAIRKVCRGNMIPVWNFLLHRVKSEKTVEKIRRNITVHGGNGAGGRRSDRGEAGGGGGSKEAALEERDAAEREVERLRQVLRRQRKELKAKMIEVSREEAERKRMLDDRGNLRHKQVTLEAYDRQCDEAAKIFAEYHKRLRYYANQARNSQRSSVDLSTEVASSIHAASEKDVGYSTVKGAKVAEDVILIETTRERNIRKTCEYLASQTLDQIRCSFPAFEGNGVHSNPQLEAAKLGYDFDGEIPEEVRLVVEHCLRSPPLLLQAITSYSQRLKSLITRETDKVDVRADAETLRYKYENNRVLDVSSPDGTAPLHYQLYGNGKVGADLPSKGSENQLLERQKAHVQQFVATEDALNRAAEARNTCQKLLVRLHGSGDVINSHLIGVGAVSQNVGTLRQFQMEVWAKEREAAGLRASVNTLISEVERLNKLCEERKEAEESLRKKWNKIEEFNSRRSELELIYTALLDANKAAAAFWSQQPLVAREYASSTIIPACRIVAELSNSAMDLIEKEMSSFLQSPDNSIYMLPASPQALMESMGASGTTGPEAHAAVEKNAALLTARAGAGDPSAIPSICRISAALQYPSGSDDALASVLKSLEFCLKLRGSEACVMEDLAKAINLVHIRRDLVESGRTLLDHAHHAMTEYDRSTSSCLRLASEQERTVAEKWLPELKNAIMFAQKSLEDCNYVRGLLDEWWEQPASTVVDWVPVDGQNVGAWVNHMKQLLTFTFIDQERL